MIDTALEFLRDNLNAFLKQRHPSTQDLVILSNLVEQSGGMNPDTAQKVVCTLVNTEKETGIYPPKVYQPVEGDDNSLVQSNAPVTLNLYVLISVNNSNYDVALRWLSSAITFFQLHNVYTLDDASFKTTGLERLAFDMLSLDFQEMSHLWGAVGSKVMPAVLYKVRMIKFFEPSTKIVPKITEYGPEPTT